jgi:hypothetical protein
VPNLTDLAVRNASPGATLWDSTLRGFGLRCGKTSKTFVVLVESGRRHSLGRYPLISLADARVEARRILAEKTLGKTKPRFLAYEEPPFDWGDRNAWRLFNATTYALRGRVAEAPQLTRQLHTVLDGICEHV